MLYLHRDCQENPDQFAKTSIECEKCKRWFHFCLKINSVEDVTKANISWICISDQLTGLHIKKKFSSNELIL